MEATYNWTQSMPLESRAIDIKVEASSSSPLGSSHSLLCVPTPPLRPSSLPIEPTSVPISTRRRTTYSLSPKRPRPYPAVLPRTNVNHFDDLSMATSPDYGNWTSRQNESMRSGSSRSHLTTSSLTGAMGDAHISGSGHRATSPGARDPQYMSMGSGMMWNMPSQASQASGPMSAHPDAFPAVPGHVPNAYDESSAQYAGYPYRNTSPESISPQSPFSANPYAYDIPSGMVPSSSESEMRHLMRKHRELETSYRQVKDRLRQLEAERASSAAAAMGFPAIASHVPVSQAFQESWNARTAARIRLFCSLNRAGNALCAWHDSRRERRAYPPRMAPPGFLNCGCTYDQALFEESLARHKVGSYHPGETVRMDPALRNPMLKLLEERYGYKDGDFERNPITGDWLEGEGPARWEQQAGAPRKPTRSDR
ncbi:hypothetical protein HGRIS_000490 [Hohenbuehelia grisea]|uniref:Uncharacterized protein n=1 Tax=Hohenbuehelia grisea TaxID=104357 RepID=A0ABR3JT35_9AGAR